MHRALIFASLVAATVLAMFVLGRIVTRGPRAVQITVWVTTAALAAFMLTSLLLSFSFHGPAGNHEQGSTDQLILRWIIHPGQFACLLLPLVASVAYFTVRPRAKPGWVSIFVLAAASMPLALVLALVTACNHAGACL